MRRKAHVRCEAGENPKITSKGYLSLFPKIDGAEMMFSASRSRKLSIVAIIQSLAQLERNYGKEGSSIIIDNTQVSLFGGFAPHSETAKVMSENLGNRTVLSGSISTGKQDPSQSLQMMQRALLTPDELKAIPKGTFVVTKTGCHPMIRKFELFLKWGITFEKEYELTERAERKVAYAGRLDIEQAIKKKYGSDKDDETELLADFKKKFRKEFHGTSS